MEVEVLEVAGLEAACRLCLTTEQARASIFAANLGVPFAEKIRFCLSIQVTSDDKLSTLVCTSCIKNINHWHSYKDTCLKAQEKLQQWLTKKTTTIQPLVTVKQEPVDIEFQDSNEQAIRNKSTVSNHIETNESRTNIVNQDNAAPVTNRVAQALPTDPSISDKAMDSIFDPEVQIKTEPMDTDDEDDCNIDVESINSGELLLNPLAVAVANSVNKEAVMEADSTQKFRTRRFITRKKYRRGPHTHFRGLRLFKKKCNHCKINLHSKHSYTQHMSRYHGIVNNIDANDYDDPVEPPSGKQKSKLTHHVDNANVEPVVDTQNEINPEDAEFEKMIKTDPLTAVQKTIIGQLKTFSCYACKQTFFDRKHTLNHIRQHMPDLRPYTCIACLTEFSDRSMYKLHCGASFECAMKIALVVPRIGHEKYFTCNMCLKAFSNRQELLNHLAVHSDKQHKQLSQPIQSPSKLASPNAAAATAVTAAFPKVDSVPYSKKPVPAGPYMNGDPLHNHMCDLCGMIYRYRPNMVKHRELCTTLPDNIRTSYRCVQCNMTYLVYKKFYTHVWYEHKKREITCFTCHAKFLTADEYLNHHETHRVYPSKENDQQQQQDSTGDTNPSVPPNSSNHPTDVPCDKPFNCALCSETFATKLELSEHRNLHLKVKIYSCVICRSMFSSSGALEIHMKEHGIDDASEQAGNSSVVEYERGGGSLNESLQSATSDPGGGVHHCYECGKNFSNYANLKRHQRNLHYKQQRRWSCLICKRRFKSVEAYDEHVRLEHENDPQLQNADKIMASPPQPQLSSPTGKPLMQCPKCPKTFAYQGNLIQHCQNVHKENHFERVARQSLPAPAPPSPRLLPPRPRIGHSCDICGKTFREEQSLKTHRGWHLRSNYRLKVDKNASMDETLMSGPGYKMTMASPAKPAKARKSFPNNPPQKQLNNIGSLQCQVCDDRFNDVAELRNHLWDVHCARNKPEKSFTSELQCELCTNKFSDEETLQDHMKWHAQNPILSNSVAATSDARNEKSAVAAAPLGVISKKQFHCDVCGKYYSHRKMFLRHKKLHKIVPAGTMMNLQSLQSSRRHYCHACQKNFATDASLKRHKASPCHMSMVRVQAQAPPKKITTTAIVHQPPPELVTLPQVKDEPGLEYAAAPSSSVHSQAQHAMKKKPVTCSVCKTIFPNMSVLYQHKQLVHKVPHAGGSSHVSRDKSLGGGGGGGGQPQMLQQQQPQQQQSTECVPLMSAEGMICCNVCGKQFPGIANLKLHFSHKHKNKTTSYPCRSVGCKLVFSSLSAMKNHENTHTQMIYNCVLCDRHVFSKVAMTKHMLTMHKAIYHSGTDKSHLWTETDLTNYNVKNCQSTACPKCKVKYPNLRALKIHYFKFHDKT